VAPTLSGVVPLHDDRIRGLRWVEENTNLETVMAQLRRLHHDVVLHEVDEHQHPHPKNCVLNLVVALDDKHRITACDRLVAGLAASHPLRAILVHLHGGGGAGILDADLTVEAHKLVSGFPVQREQVLLHVRGEAAHHLSSLVEPLLVNDVPTYLWWSGRHRLDEEIVQDAISFSDVLVVDSGKFEHPIDALLELAGLAADPDATVGVADFRWGRMRPWRDAISMFFGPADRRPLVGGIQEISVDAAGSGPDARAGAALLAGWMAWALGWRLGPIAGADDTTTAVAGTGEGHHVRLTLRAVPNDRLNNGELLTVRLSGHHQRRRFTLTIERDAEGDDHAHVTIQLDGGEPVRQRLTLPRLGDPDLLIHVMWANRRDPVFQGALRAAAPLLEALRQRRRSGGDR
jgi:glucose-6-phosphate dehydrogenase assembly protein OpcA